MKVLFDIMFYLGIVLGGLLAVGYFTWTGTILKWKKGK
jgi:hypothetical protein